MDSASKIHISDSKQPLRWTAAVKSQALLLLNTERFPVSPRVTHTYRHRHPSIHAYRHTFYIHANTQPDIHGKSVSLAPHRLRSNLRSRSRELATCALGAGRKCQPGSSVKKRFAMALSSHQPFHKGFCLGASVSVCQSFSVEQDTWTSARTMSIVCLGRSVSVCLSQSV